jgi:hypothetical protein
LSKPDYRFPAIVICLIVVAKLSFAQADTSQQYLSSPVFMSNGAFCPGGVVPDLKWNLAEEGGPAAVWGSACHDTGDVGRVESTAFLAPPRLTLFLAGYVGLPGLRVILRNLETNEEIELHPQSVPGESWQRNDFVVPSNWIGKPVQIIGDDQVAPTPYWLGLTAPLLPYASVAGGMIHTDRSQSGFCRDGAFPNMHWQGSSPPSGLVVWGSFCEAGDNGTGWMATDHFVADSYLSLYVAGYPGSVGVRLALENLETGRQLPLLVEPLPRENWQFYRFPLPPAWKGQQVRLLAEDTAARPTGWVAFAMAPPRSLKKETSFALRLLLLTLLLTVIWILPPIAICMAASHQGVRDFLDLTAIALVAVGVIGYLSFWIYFFSRTAGLIFSYIVLVSSCVVVVYLLRKAHHWRSWASLRSIVVPWIFLILASCFVTSLGFVYGKPQSIQDYSAYRFAPPHLSIDNFLPKILADDVFRGHIPVPFNGDWHSSDRPPLQAGMFLWNYAWTARDRDLPYQVLGVIFQLTCLLALWAYLEAAQVSRKLTMLVLAAVLFSGFVFLNSFFGWPKLLPVAFLLIIPAYLLTDRYAAARSDWRIGAVAGAAAALAMLCHGGSAFALLGLACTLLLLRRIPSQRFFIAALCAAFILYLPWTLYQKYYDPPGDRLLKWHLGGKIEPHPNEKLGHLIASSYRELSLKEIADNKIGNVTYLFGKASFLRHPWVLFLSFFTGNEEARQASVAALRFTMFLRWFWSIDLFSFAPIAFLAGILFVRQRSLEMKQAWYLWLCTAITLVIWCLLMFLPGSTQVHQGCYFTELAAIAGGILALWAMSPKLAVLVVTCHIVFNLAVYVFFAPPEVVGFSTLMGPLNPILATVSALSGFACATMLWKMANDDSANRSDNAT